MGVFVAAHALNSGYHQFLGILSSVLPGVIFAGVAGGLFAGIFFAAAMRGVAARGTAWCTAL